MWYEHGQSDTLINLDVFAWVEVRDDSVILRAPDHSIKILKYESEADACQAYQIIRSKLMKIPIYNGGQ
jgi:hypothetical protein